MRNTYIDYNRLSLYIKTHKIIRGILNNIKPYKYWFKKLKKSLKVPFKLDVHAVEHCNLNCKGCSHFSPIAKPKYLDPVELAKSLKILTKFQSSFQLFQIIGGEPLLHPQLSDILNVSRRYFDKIPITLMTNGILLLKDDKLPALFWETCKQNDIIIKLTKYPIDIDYAAIEEKIISKGIKFEFFKDRSKKYAWGKYQLHETDIRTKSDRCKIFKYKYCASLNCFQLVGDKIYPCHLSAYVNHLNSAFNRSFNITKQDYIDLNNLKHTWQIRRLLMYAIPFCKYCGKEPEKDSWCQSEKKLQEWIDTRFDKI